MNPGLRSIQCGRRNDAFKLWAAWQAVGDNGWHDRLEQLFNLATFAAEYVEQSPHFELCQKPDYLTICFKVHGINPTELFEGNTILRGGQDIDKAMSGDNLLIT